MAVAGQPTAMDVVGWVYRPGLAEALNDSARQGPAGTWWMMKRVGGSLVFAPSPGPVICVAASHKLPLFY